MTCRPMPGGSEDGDQCMTASPAAVSERWRGPLWNRVRGAVRASLRVWPIQLRHFAADRKIWQAFSREIAFRKDMIWICECTRPAYTGSLPPPPRQCSQNVGIRNPPRL